MALRWEVGEESTLDGFGCEAEALARLGEDDMAFVAERRTIEHDCSYASRRDRRAHTPPQETSQHRHCERLATTWNMVEDRLTQSGFEVAPWRAEV
jgi:hypothetical protein